MQYMRCKCGKSEAWTSGMPNNPCEGCPECNTTFSYGPNGHKEVQPHEFTFETKVDTDEGEKILSRCHWCYKSKRDLEKREESRKGKIQ